MSEHLDRIYLEPDCPECGPPQGETGRQWCQDDVFSGECPGCGQLVEALVYDRRTDGDTP
jgi:hypothetical protein